MKSTTASANELLSQAKDMNFISPQSARALTGVVDLGQNIQEALGVPVDDFEQSEVILVTLLVDDSGSIRFSGNTQVVREGCNLVVESLLGTKQKDSMLIHCRYLNGQALYPYTTLDDAIELDAHNYDPTGGTPLYDQAAVVLGTVVAKAQEFISSGVQVRTVTLIVTDGADEHSRNQSASSVRNIVEDMLQAETNIIAFMGIDNGYTDFNTVAGEMGIPDSWVLTPGNSESEIRKAFQMFSQSAVRASQNAQAFSAAALGGFGV